MPQHIQIFALVVLVSAVGFCISFAESLAWTISNSNHHRSVLNSDVKNRNIVNSLTRSSTTKAPMTMRLTIFTTKAKEDVDVVYKINKPVSLQVPGELFALSFEVASNASQIMGHYVMSLALRAHRIADSLRPVLRRIFGERAIVIEATLSDKVVKS